MVKQASVKGRTKRRATQSKKSGGFFQFMMKTFFNLPAWIGFKQAKDSTRIILNYIKDVFLIKRTIRQETFEEAQTRLKLSKKQLQETYRTNQRNFYILLLFVIILVAYGIYLLTIGAYRGLLIDLAVIAFASVKVFQFSFWNFQIRHKKLNCTLREWFAGCVDKPSKELTK